MTGLLAAMLIVGCSRGPTLVEAAGLVTLAGKPVARAALLMEPVAGGQVASGNTDADGRFFMGVTNHRGVPPGTYRVSIALNDIVGGNPDKVGDFTNVAIVWIVPERYGRPDTSGLEVTLDRDRTDLVFALEP